VFAPSLNEIDIPSARTANKVKRCKHCRDKTGYPTVQLANIPIFCKVFLLAEFEHCDHGAFCGSIRTRAPRLSREDGCDALLVAD
jgi:hypothetical protein